MSSRGTQLLVLPMFWPSDGQVRMTLCDQDGSPLPGQRAVQVTHRVGEPSTVLVEFVIDGHSVRVGK